MGGTTEARKLVEALGARAVLSLAGATPRPLAVPHLVGGFGGAAGLADYLRAGKFEALIDATHPFAKQISLNAVTAAAQAEMPLLRLARPAWPMREGWQAVPDLNSAATILPTGARVFLSVGSRSLGPFLKREDVWFLSRSIVAPKALPANGQLLLQRPPFALANEVRLLREHRISHLVSKNAGGEAVQAKLEAAEALGIKVIMVERPQLPDAFTVASVPEAVKWVENLGE